MSPFLFPLLLRLLPVSAVTRCRQSSLPGSCNFIPTDPTRPCWRDSAMGFTWVFLPPKTSVCQKIKPSAAQHPSVVDLYLANEVYLGRVAGPFSAPPYPNLHVSSFRAIPKRGQPGKWHLIVDLSSPGGASVNDGIDQGKFTHHYITLDEVIHLLSKLGVGPSWSNLMWKQLTTMRLYTHPITFFWG